MPVVWREVSGLRKEVAEGLAVDLGEVLYLEEVEAAFAEFHFGHKGLGASERFATSVCVSLASERRRNTL